MKVSGEHLRDGDQLRLDLFHDVPWDGRSPRGLTRVGLGLYLRPEPPSHEVYFDPEQLEIWPVDRPPREKSLPTVVCGGASLLLEPYSLTRR